MTDLIEIQREVARLAPAMGAAAARSALISALLAGELVGVASQFNSSGPFRWMRDADGAAVDCPGEATDFELWPEFWWPEFAIAGEHSFKMGEHADLYTMTDWLAGDFCSTTIFKAKRVRHSARVYRAKCVRLRAKNIDLSAGLEPTGVASTTAPPTPEGARVGSAAAERRAEQWLDQQMRTRVPTTKIELKRLAIATFGVSGKGFDRIWPAPARAHGYDLPGRRGQNSKPPPQ
jgi:hypothetical protein